MIVLPSTAVQCAAWETDLNGTLNEDVSPDSRLSQSAFFAVNLADFGVTSGLWWSHAPVAEYELKVYTLRVGKYTYTNPDDTPWGEREPERDWWQVFVDSLKDGFSDFMGNPLTWIVAGVVLLFALSVTGVLDKILLLIALRRR